MYGIYANIWGILMVNVTIYSIHGSYGYSRPNSWPRARHGNQLKPAPAAWVPTGIRFEDDQALGPLGMVGNPIKLVTTADGDYEIG